ncbi:MAG: hypothetical protein ABIP94_17575, partial [Planctomycetota bacterium]
GAPAAVAPARCLRRPAIGLRRRLRPQRFPAQAKPHWHYAVLNDHLHFVVDATGRATLSRGVQGLLVRIARALNRLWHRRGRVFADRRRPHPALTARGAERAALRRG